MSNAYSPVRPIVQHEQAERMLQHLERSGIDVRKQIANLLACYSAPDRRATIATKSPTREPVAPGVRLWQAGQKRAGC